MSAITITGSGAVNVSTTSTSSPGGIVSSKARVPPRTCSSIRPTARNGEPAVEELSVGRVAWRVEVQDRTFDVAALPKRIVDQRRRGSSRSAPHHD